MYSAKQRFMFKILKLGELKCMQYLNLAVNSTKLQLVML